MTDFLTILPLAFVMVAGPQIISAVFLATSENWGRNSAAFLAGVLLTVPLFVSASYLLANVVKSGGGDSGDGTVGRVIDIVIIALLLFLAVYVFLKRTTAEPPRWMGRLQTATPGFSFKLGFLLLGVFPTDIATSFAVGSYLARQGQPLTDAIPFVLLTLFLEALPVLLVLAFGKRARVFLPQARDWMNTNSWIVSEIVIVFFLVITVSGMGG